MKRAGGTAAMALAVAMSLISTAVSYAAPSGEFSDVAKNAWYAEAVRYCDENGLMSGTSDTEFSPGKTMTRAMLAAALYRQTGSPSVSGNDNFPDTDAGTWYSDAVIWASQNKIITGYANGRFGTNDSVTREQIVTILWRMAGSPAAFADSQANSFSDGSSISGYAADAVLWASSNGIVSGKPDNRFDPKGNATRAEVASILANNAKAGGNSALEEKTDINAYALRVVEMVNEERGKAGLAPVAIDEKLCEIAQIKAEDMRDNNYFDHNSPTYGRSHEMMKQFGINVLASGENIGMGQKTPGQVMNEWMSSQGHRENILNATYDRIGVGYCIGGSGKVYWVQMFAK